ncbi:MAG: c-type cytochrome [Blastocatellia bacterium]
MRFKTLTFALLIALTGLAGWASNTHARRVQAQRQTRVTFNKDVAPIFFEHCVSCHRPGEAAPMSLLTWREARPWGRAIREKVATRQMPPWHADPRVNEYANDRRLSEKEIATIVAWADQGAVEGAPQDLPSQPRCADQLHRGQVGAGGGSEAGQSQGRSSRHGLRGSAQIAVLC